MSQELDNWRFAHRVQTVLKNAGHYRGKVDAWAGPMTRAAFDAFAIGVPETPPLDDGERSSPQGFVLPLENNDDISAFYGPPGAAPDYLAWFSFPMETRLYSRGGIILRDRNLDDTPDHACHEHLSNRLTSALEEILRLLGPDEYRRQGWHVYGGCHNYRAKRGGSSLSTHAWGVAVDMNPIENPFTSGATTFSDAAIDVMEKWGFLSGGRAWGRDWMHFQAVIPRISTGTYYATRGLPKTVRAAIRA